MAGASPSRNQGGIGLTLPAHYPSLNTAQRRAARLLYQEIQEQRCYYCKHQLNHLPAPEVRQKLINTRLFPKGFFRNPVHLHHCHKTGMTIGAVHAYCNAVLWEYHNE